jgi:hypothetical protein
MAAIEPSRLKGIVTMLAVLSACVAVFGLTAQGLAPAMARAMADGDSTMEGGQDAIVGGRISGVLAEARRGMGDPSGLGVVLGPSAAGMDIDPRILEETGSPLVPKRWLNLYANGANATDLRGLADLLFMSRIQIDLIVLAIDPVILARSDAYLSDTTTVDFRPFLRAYEAGHLTSARQELAALSLVPLHRLFPERIRIGHQSRVLVSWAKMRLFSAIGLGADSLYPPDLDPWTVRLLMRDEAAEGRAANADRRVTAREIREGPMRNGLFGELKDKGWYEVSSYSSQGRAASDLIAIMSRARSHGAEVFIMLVPERSNLRSRIPPAALRCFHETLERGFGALAPPILDLRDAVADDGFHDDLHLKQSGRRQATMKLAQALRERTVNRKPQDQP